MIISHKHKFIFIKTGKTAGTSIEGCLARQCGEQDVVTPLYPPVVGHKARNYQGFCNPIDEFLFRRGRKNRLVWQLFHQNIRFYNHIPAQIVKKRVSHDVWNNYFKFCVERNPYTKSISQYRMLHKRSNGRLTLEQFFARGLLRSDFRHYTGVDGELIVDTVLRYEDLHQQLADVCARLAVPFEADALGREKTITHTENIELSDKQKAMIQRLFSNEFTMFEYSK
ncbi:MAG: sulfotransferase family 2 domain-containing protein [Mariprofundaceae bacterium]|nr:sulfotransferase family 2 domain-containing protein [Mariprofundaceae bacterium]